MGDAMEEGTPILVMITLLEWTKSEGDTVKSGEIIGTIQTDKAVMELEAPATGTLSGLLIKAEETVPVGKPIAAILKSGEKLPNNWGGIATPKSEPAKESKTEKDEITPSIIKEINEKPVSNGSSRIKATPLAKKIAQEKGIDLSSIAGSGPGGRIVEKDLLSAPASTPKPAANQATQQTEKISLNRLRSIIAERTQHSKQTVPHFYVTREVDLEKILSLRKQFEQDNSGKVSINDFVVKASAKALKDMPIVNSSFGDKEIIQHGEINIGIAAAVDEGLLVPVIKNADQKSIRSLSSDAKELVTKARSGKLSPDEMSGSTFSISNMGMLDVDNFVAIINEPNAAIVAISSGRKIAAVNESNEIEVRTRMNITGSFDHRIVDGAIGAKFMNVLREYLENPTRLLE